MVYVHFAEGFEEVEAVTIVDLLRRAAIDVKMVSIMEDKMVEGAHGMQIQADLLFCRDITGDFPFAAYRKDTHDPGFEFTVVPQVPKAFIGFQEGFADDILRILWISQCVKRHTVKILCHLIIQHGKTLCVSLFGTADILQVDVQYSHHRSKIPVTITVPGFFFFIPYPESFLSSFSKQSNCV